MPFQKSPNGPIKPRKPRSRTPVESFGPEMLATLIKGGSEPVEITFPTPKMATQFILRMNMLRKRMREEDHPQSGIAQRAKLSNQRDGQHTNIVRIVPYDHEFRSFLTASGVDVQSVRTNLLTDIIRDSAPTPLPEPPSDFHERLQILEDLEKEGK